MNSGKRIRKVLSRRLKIKRESKPRGTPKAILLARAKRFQFRVVDASASMPPEQTIYNRGISLAERRAYDHEPIPWSECGSSMAEISGADLAIFAQNLGRVRRRAIAGLTK